MARDPKAKKAALAARRHAEEQALAKVLESLSEEPDGAEPPAGSHPRQYGAVYLEQAKAVASARKGVLEAVRVLTGGQDDRAIASLADPDVQKYIAVVNALVSNEQWGLFGTAARHLLAAVNTIGGLEETVTVLEGQAQAASGQLQDLQSVYDAECADHAQTKLNLSGAERALVALADESSKEREAGRKKSAELAHALDAEQADHQETKAELQAQSSAVVALTGENNRLSGDLDAARARADNLEGANQDFSAENVRLQAVVAAQGEEIKTLRAENVKLAAETKALKDERDAVTPIDDQLSGMVVAVEEDPVLGMQKKLAEMAQALAAEKAARAAAEGDVKSLRGKLSKEQAARASAEATTQELRGDLSAAEKAAEIQEKASAAELKALRAAVAQERTRANYLAAQDNKPDDLQGVFAAVAGGSQPVLPALIQAGVDGRRVQIVFKRREEPVSNGIPSVIGRMS